MESRFMWKVLPFPKTTIPLRETIQPDNWVDFNDFLTNESNGVYVAQVFGSLANDILDGNLVIVDRNLKPVAGDFVVTNENGNVESYSGGNVIGVITARLDVYDSHRRQRMRA